MAQINKANVKVGGSVSNSKVKGGEIHLNKGKDTEAENDASVEVVNDVTGDSEVEGGTIKVSSEWSELNAEVHQFLEQLARTPITTNEAVATEAVKQEIQQDITLRRRLVSALKAGGSEALVAIFDHPVVSISVEAVKGFLEAG